MKNKIWKKLFWIAPIVIVLFMLTFLNYTIQFLKDMTYRYIYETNVSAVKRFALEVDTLISDGYNTDEYCDIYVKTMHVYNRVLGERDAIISFLMDKNGTIYHSNSSNEQYLNLFLEHKSNILLIQNIIHTNTNGEIHIKTDDLKETLFYQMITNGKEEYYLFMTLDRQLVESKLSANQIVIPVGVIGLLFLFMTESAIWLQMARIIDEEEIKQGTV